MKQAKPIVVVKLSNEISDEHFEHINLKLKGLLGNDYYVLVVTEERQQMEIQVFYEKDHIPIDLEEIEKLVEQKYQTT